MTTNRVLCERKEEDFGQRLAQTGWYHSMELPGGRIIPGFLTLEQLRERYDSFLLPPDLTGKRVLDVGTWDGWFAFEAERRGAEVVAVDLVEQENFHYAHRALNSKVHYVLADVYEIPRLGLGRFDYTLFLGVLYHLRHPSLALDTVCGLTKETAIVDSFVIDGDNRAHVGSMKPMNYATTLTIGSGRHWTASFLFAGRPGPRVWSNETSATATQPWHATVGRSLLRNVQLLQLLFSSRL